MACVPGVFYSTLLGEMLPPVGDGRRAGCWKRARRQRGKIEAQRRKEAQKREREVERDVNACVERLISRLEKMHASVDVEDGQPYLDTAVSVG